MRPMSYTGPIMPRPPTTPIPSVPTQTHPSFGQVVKEGFAFGIGSSIAQRIFGPSKQIIVHEHKQQSINETVQTSTLSKESQQTPNQHMYNQCILEGGNEEVCKQYITE